MVFDNTWRSKLLPAILVKLRIYSRTLLFGQVGQLTLQSMFGSPDIPWKNPTLLYSTTKESYWNNEEP